MRLLAAVGRPGARYRGHMLLPPLVAPGPALPPRERDRAARQLRLPGVGESGQRRLLAARVLVVGAGGLGSPVLQYLAAAGVGTIGVVDDDVVEATNLQRQVLFTAADVGRPKVAVAAERVRALAPDARVVEHAERLTASNAHRLLAGYDVVVDGSDTFTTRYDVADACTQLGLPLVWGAVLRFDAQATVFWSRPPVGPGVVLRDVFPEPPAPGAAPSCAEAGVLGTLCGQLGSILATEVVKLVCGLGETLLGRMLVLDTLSARTREVPLVAAARREPGAAVVSAGACPERSGDAAPRRVAVEELDALAGATLVDVREPDEYARGSIPGAVSVPLDRVLDGSPSVRGSSVGDAGSLALGLLDDVATLVVFCQAGPRARAAARALTARRPGADVRVLDGGYAAWSGQGRA